VQIESTQHASCLHEASSKKISQSHRFYQTKNQNLTLPGVGGNRATALFKSCHFWKNREYVPKMPLSLNKTRVLNILRSIFSAQAGKKGCGWEMPVSVFR
jgi:hypothetical protein